MKGPILSLRSVIAVVALVFVAMGCTPSIVVKNNTTIGVRVMVKTDKGSDVVSPSVEGSSTVESSGGRFTATAVEDQVWADYMRQNRQTLVNFLQKVVNGQASLPTQELEQLFANLRDIDARIADFARFQPSLIGNTCTGSVDSNGEGDPGSATVTISQTDDGKLAASCR